VREHGTDIGLLGPQAAEPGRLVIGEEMAGEAPRHLQVAPGVPPPALRVPAGLGEPLGRVLALRAEQPVPAATHREHHRLVHQRGQDVADAVARHLRARRHVPRRGEVERPGEDGEPVPHRLLGLRAQAVGPLDRGPQGLVPRRAAAPRAGQHGEPGLKALGQLGRRQRPHPHGGELDRERDAVEPPAEPDHVGTVRVGDGEAGQRRGGAIGEQLDRVARRGVAAGPRHRQRAQPQHLLAGNVQRLPARRQDRDFVRRPQQLRGELRAGGSDVLAGVEDQQQPFAAQVVEDGGVG
jgi:hypothetical protein